MVRIKNRYLLVNILYPELEKGASKSEIPDVISFNQPTTNALNAPTLLRGIRAGVADLFGDYGSGAIASSLAIKYLSPATSTFILRVSRDHYRIAWAALSFMNSVPIKNGKNCVFRVVRVSGTIRKAEEEAIRRAKEIIVKARREAGEKGESTLDNIFGKTKDGTTESTKDVLMVDGSDSEEEGYMSDGDG
ncbi:Ribonuclease P/MRP protein subunit POP5 [Lachnellula hyalina]|uniref:Ribonuclease P/MRP protein subunit POP5 n=1 Tax=Lachnellula hyalina TaxID=1316788 RepID=A0A8H8R883_9HELO|nr:Ribonuclease P/MRP protein subunit POP5 [Lachnellula hyalina]TVY30230.1 Ribonuclease P/MRP protein subunit POP5 [Lachnellula hyalina]